MSGFLVRRLLASLLTALLASMVVFAIVRTVPGDIVMQMMGQSSDDPRAEAALRAFFGLDQPLYRQYLDWLWRVLQGDLGRSWNKGLDVADAVWSAFLVTLELGLLTLLLATFIGVPLGLLAALREGRWLDHALQTINLLGLSAPVFWVGLMLLVGASSLLAWSPPLIYRGPSESFSDNLAMLVLPVLSLGVLQAAAYAQFTRQAVISAKREDYVRTARAKGMPLTSVYFKHILRNILIPLVTFMGLILIQILGGVVIIESLFSLPGLGRLLLSSLQQRDFPLVQGALLLIVVVALLVNLAVDLLYRLIDPRTRS